MICVTKHFNELTTEELFNIYKLRVAVFVVEQNCPYQEIDDAGKFAYHLYLKNEDGIQAYLRVLPQGITYDDVSIGRVISIKRHQGLATQLLQVGIQFAEGKLNARRITIGAQTYVRKLYESVGFVQSSKEYLEDGIPHIHMIWKSESELSHLHVKEEF